MESHTIQHSHAKKKTNAQGLVEFALILPVLLLVLFGIVDMGWIAFNFSQLYNGVREGVRYGSVSGFTTPAQYLSCDKIRSALIAQAGFSGVKATNITVEYDDGRTITATSKSRVGCCPASGSFTQDANYTPQGSASASGRNVVNGDRIVITLGPSATGKKCDNTTTDAATVPSLQFLTPLIRSFAKSGISVGFTTSRSVFPNGLLARAELM